MPTGEAFGYQGGTRPRGSDLRRHMAMVAVANFGVACHQKFAACSAPVVPWVWTCHMVSFISCPALIPGLP
jgi:hypothetical protein